MAAFIGFMIYSRLTAPEYDPPLYETFYVDSIEVVQLRDGRLDVKPRAIAFRALDMQYMVVIFDGNGRAVFNADEEWSGWFQYPRTTACAELVRNPCEMGNIVKYEGIEYRNHYPERVALGWWIGAQEPEFKPGEYIMKTEWRQRGGRYEDATSFVSAPFKVGD